MKSRRTNLMAFIITVLFGFGLLSADMAGITVYGDDDPFINYVEEDPTTIDIPSTPSMIEGVEGSVAGFLGEAERGPSEPRLLRSWEEYSMLYGGSKNSSSYLLYAVKGFFENGGKKLYVARIVDKAAAAATVTLLSGKAPVLTLRAIGEGSWGNRLQVQVSEASESSKGNPMFKLEINYWDTKPTTKIYNSKLNKLKVDSPLKEVFDNLSMDQESESYYVYKIRQDSKLITVDKEAGDLEFIPDSFDTPVFFNGGIDGESLDLEDYLGDEEAGPDAAGGLAALDAIDEISLLYCPDTLSIEGLANELIRHCELLKDRMVILDSQKGDADPMHNGDFNSSYAACYYPWIITDGVLAGTQLLVPPGGHIAGIYALTEAQYGIHKAPAGVVIKGAKGLEFNINQQRLDTLNFRGVNAVRELTGRGITVWGARTLDNQANTEYKYVNVRRLKNYIEESVEDGLAWTRNWRNNQELWMIVKPCISDFLTQEWRKGHLMGTRDRDAFYVMVDRTTMNQADVEEGRLIIHIGAALLKPGEFYTIRIMLPVQGSS